MVEEWKEGGGGDKEEEKEMENWRELERERVDNIKKGREIYNCNRAL